MEKFTVYLTAAQRHGLARAARATGRSRADLVREGVDRVTAGHRGKAPTPGLFASRGEAAARRVDELLEGFGEQ